MTRNNKSRRGQTLVEYALILGFISVVALGVLVQLSGGISSTFAKINAELATAKTGGASGGGRGP